MAFDNKAPADAVLKNLTVGRQLGYAGYLTLDSITLVDTLGFKKFDSAKKLQEYSYRAWLSGLVCSVVAGVYTLYRLQEREKAVDRKEGEGVVEAKKIERYVLFSPFAGVYANAMRLVNASPLASNSSLISVI